MTTLFEQSEALPAPAPAPAPPPVVPLKGVGEDDWLDACFKEPETSNLNWEALKKRNFMAILRRFLGYGNFGGFLDIMFLFSFLERTLIGFEVFSFMLKDERITQLVG